MQINLTPIKVKDVFDQFMDNGEDGVFGYNDQKKNHGFFFKPWFFFYPLSYLAY